jgi:predicted RNA-binding protein with TRAM domain
VKYLYKKNSRSSYSGGFNSFERMEPRDAPVEVGKQYDVKIEDIAKQGDGIARVNGFVIFVPSTQINDELKIEIKAVKRNFAFGEAV